MNRLVLLLIAACIAAGLYFILRPTHPSVPQEVTPPQAENGWRSYLPPSGQFAVELPVLPQHAADTINDSVTQQLRRYEMYVAEAADGSVYMINMITYPPHADLANHEQVFKSFIDDMVASNPRNKLVSSQSAHFQGQDAQDFTLQNDEGLLVSKMFLKGQTLYVLSRLAKTGSPNDGEFQKFVSSFKLKD